MEIATITLPLHIVGLLIALWNIYHADHMGLSWVLGKRETLDASDVMKHHKGTWFGLSILIITGIILFYPMREFLLTRVQFYLKMAFVLTIFVNGIAITFLQKRATLHSFKDMTLRQKAPLFISAMVSSLGWLGAIIMAFLLIPE